MVMACHNSGMPAWKERLGHTHRHGNRLVLSPKRSCPQLAVSQIRCGFGGHRLIPPDEVVFIRTRLRQDTLMMESPCLARATWPSRYLRRGLLRTEGRHWRYLAGEPLGCHEGGPQNIGLGMLCHRGVVLRQEHDVQLMTYHPPSFWLTNHLLSKLIGSKILQAYPVIPQLNEMTSSFPSYNT